MVPTGLDLGQNLNMREWLAHLSPQQFKQVFYLGQAAVGGLLILLLLRARMKGESQSAFGAREEDRPKPKPWSREARRQSGLGDARIATQAQPLRLGGISIDAPAHEILGIPANADAAAIQRAWRERMKQYHPDAVGRPGSREWQDSQRIAEAINRAKEQLLAAAAARADHSRNPKRSGR